MHLWITKAFLLWLWVFPLWAQDGKISQKVLDNGMEIIVIEDHSLPLVTLEIAAKNGAFTESPEYDGLSHLYEHMFFKGNRAIPNQEAYMARQRELGMVWNGTTTTERVNYFFTLTKEHFEEGMVFMKDAIRYPLFDEKELERERQVVLDEYNRNEANPYFHLMMAVDHKLWYKYFSRKNTIGDREIVATATPEKMRFVQDRYYVPNNIALFVAGDVDPQRVFELSGHLYAHWNRRKDPFKVAPIPEHPPLLSDEVVIVRQPVQQVTVLMAWHGPDVRRDVEATYAADVMSFIVNQRSAHLQKALIDTGLALSVSVSYYTQSHTGPIQIYLKTRPEHLKEAVLALEKEIKRWAEPQAFSDEQLKTAKVLLEVDDLYAREKTSAWVHTLSFWWAVSGLDYYFHYLEHLKAVQQSDIQRYVQKYIVGKPRVIGVMCNEETAKTLDPATILSWIN